MTSFDATISADTARGGVRRTPVRIARLGPKVEHVFERRLALLDEIDTVIETRQELSRSAQLVGGHDDGQRPPRSASFAAGARHELAATLARIDHLQQAFDELKRSVNEASR